MEAEARAAPRPRRASCERCARPMRVCLCPSLPPRAVNVPRLHVLVLQHNEEAKASLMKRTVPVLQHVLGGWVGGGGSKMLVVP
jgi:DTW domain-containing protein YfiP